MVLASTASASRRDADSCNSSACRINRRLSDSLLIVAERRRARRARSRSASTCISRPSFDVDILTLRVGGEGSLLIHEGRRPIQQPIIRRMTPVRNAKASAMAFGPPSMWNRPLTPGQPCRTQDNVMAQKLAKKPRRRKPTPSARKRAHCGARNGARLEIRSSKNLGT